MNVLIFVGLALAFVYWQAPRLGWFGVSTPARKRLYARKMLGYAAEGKLRGRPLLWGSQCDLVRAVADAIEDTDATRADTLRQGAALPAVRDYGEGVRLSSAPLLCAAVMAAQNGATGETAELLQELWHVLVGRTARRVVPS